MDTAVLAEFPQLRVLNEEGDIDVAVLEDEKNIRDLVILMLTTYFEDRIHRLFLTDRVRDLLEIGRKYEFKPDLVFTDYELNGTPVPMERVAADLGERQTNTAFILSSGYGGRIFSNFVPPVPSVRYVFLAKPFDVTAFRAAVSSAIEHISLPSAVGSTFPPLDNIDEESIFSCRFDEFDAFSDLVAELPEDPSRIISYEDRFDHLAEFLEDVLADLLEALHQGYDVFSKKWNETFPSSKRESLVSVLAEHVGADFALDVCMHDIRNILGALTVMSEDDRESVWPACQPAIEDILAPASSVFSKYRESHEDDISFWCDQQLHCSLPAVGDVYSDIDSGQVDLSAEVYAPAGALHSIWETFASNALKVADRVGFMLNLRLQQEGDTLKAYVFDDLKEFDPLQLVALFADVIPSEDGKWGEGTGLFRLNQLLCLLWKNHSEPPVCLESYHREGNGWMRKVAEEPPRMLVNGTETIDDVCDNILDGTTKFFVLRIPLKCRGD